MISTLPSLSNARGAVEPFDRASSCRGPWRLVLGDLNAYVHQLHAAAMPDEYRPYACDAAAQYFAGVIEDDSHMGSPLNHIRFAAVGREAGQRDEVEQVRGPAGDTFAWYPAS